MLERKIAEASIEPRPPKDKRIPILLDWRSLAVIAAIAIITNAGYSVNSTFETPQGYKGSFQLEHSSR